MDEQEITTTHAYTQMLQDEAECGDKLNEEQINEINNTSSMKEKIIAILKTVYDPEIPVNIWELGLIYEIDISSDNITVKMTLTSPSCPVAESMPTTIRERLKQFLPQCCSIEIQLVWEPQWEVSMISENAKLLLDIV